MKGGGVIGWLRRRRQPAPARREVEATFDSWDLAGIVLEQRSDGGHDALCGGCGTLLGCYAHEPGCPRA